jgi:hypothetical protein
MYMYISPPIVSANKSLPRDDKYSSASIYIHMHILLVASWSVTWAFVKMQEELVTAHFFLGFGLWVVAPAIPRMSCMDR